MNLSPIRATRCRYSIRVTRALVDKDDVENAKRALNVCETV